MKQRDRERTCIVTGKKAPGRQLLRFVLAPDGIIVPDLAAKLPGRGVWTLAKREVVLKALKKGAFARGVKTKVVLDEGKTRETFVDEIETALANRVLAALGLARRSGSITVGTDATLALLQKRSNQKVLNKDVPPSPLKPLGQYEALSTLANSYSSDRVGSPIENEVASTAGIIFCAPETSERTKRTLSKAANAATLSVSFLLRGEQMSTALGLNGVKVVAMSPTTTGLLADTARLTHFTQHATPRGQVGDVHSIKG